jgi:hypothetical protein
MGLILLVEGDPLTHGGILPVPPQKSKKLKPEN